MKRHVYSLFRFLFVGAIWLLIVLAEDAHSPEFIHAMTPAKGSLVIHLASACMMASVVTLLYDLLDSATQSSYFFLYVRGIAVALFLQLTYIVVSYYLDVFITNQALPFALYELIVILLYLLPAVGMLYILFKHQ